MTKAPFQVLVFPYIESPDGYQYAIFKRNPETGGFWQGVSGGGEQGETALEAARREAFEEAGILQSSSYILLTTQTSIPVVNLAGFSWGPEVLVIPEYSFGVRVPSRILELSHEHTEYRWCSYDEAVERLQWDGNRTALWELDHRLRHGLIGDPADRP